jgi:hypothetical protein
MIGKMTKEVFDRLGDDDRWMLVSGFQDSEDVDIPLDPKDQAIADRDAIIEAQHQSLQKAEVVINQASEVISRYRDAIANPVDI